METLSSLKAAIEGYLADNEEGKEEVTVDVDEDDAFVGESNLTAKYTVLASPIVIKKIEITKT